MQIDKQPKSDVATACRDKDGKIQIFGLIVGDPTQPIFIDESKLPDCSD